MTKTNLFLVSLVPGIPALFLLYLLIDALFLSGSSPGGMLFVVAILAAVGCLGLVVLAGASFYIGESAAPRAPKKAKDSKSDKFAEGGDDGGDVSFGEESPAVIAIGIFESHLYRVERVQPGTPEYASSDYSHLVEAMIIAFLARYAFIERYWKTDVHGMLRRWLTHDLCQLFFDGDENFIEEFRAEMKRRAQSQYSTAGGALQRQYMDIEAGISETNPDGGGAAFG